MLSFLYLSQCILFIRTSEYTEKLKLVGIALEFDKLRNERPPVLLSYIGIISWNYNKFISSLWIGTLCEVYLMWDVEKSFILPCERSNNVSNIVDKICLVNASCEQCVQYSWRNLEEFVLLFFLFKQISNLMCLGNQLH